MIVPTEGGIAEMVEDGINGYKMDVQELDEIADKIEKMMTDGELYAHLAENALSYSHQYDRDAMVDAVLKHF